LNENRRRDAEPPRRRKRLAIGYVGEDGIKPNVAYRVENEKLVEAK